MLWLLIVHAVPLAATTPLADKCTTALAAVGCVPPSSATACYVCVGQHQHALRAAGCSNAEAQRLCAGVPVRGSLDGIDGAKPHCSPRCEASSPGPVIVSGWAVDPNLAGGGRPPVNVSIIVDGVVAATGLADKPRPDLVPAHAAPDPYHGFSIRLPPDVAKVLLSPSKRKVKVAALVNEHPLPDPNGCARLSCTSVPSDRYEYVQLGSLKVGIDMSRGGSISYMSSKATHGLNIVNAHDMGREIQLSFYSGPNFYNPPTEAYPNGACDKLFGGVPWPWNPIGAGDVDENHGQILSFSKTASSWHILTRPLQWACHNVSCDCTFEQWGTLDGTGLNLTSTLHTDRSDTTPYPAHSQELPAVYSNGPWYRLLAYNGSRPWEKQPPSEYATGFRGPGAKGGAWIPGPMGVLSEHWAALMNEDLSSGLGVINMDTSSFIAGFSGAKGSGGTTDAPTGYIAPISQVVIPNKGDFSFSAFFTLGTVEEIRDYAYSMRDKVDDESDGTGRHPN